LKATKSCIKLRAMKNVFNRQLLLLAFTALTLLAASGCATTEDDASNEKPWNAPKSWETGIPTGMMQGR
jgi:hypothetical protein